MRTRETSRLLSPLAKPTPVQRAVLLLRLRTGEQRDQAAVIVQQRLPARPHCPKCGATHVVGNGQADGLQRHKWRACTITFNALTGTPLSRLRHRHLWLAQCEALQDGLSVRRAAAGLCVHRTTAFRWRHRFLQCPAEINDLAMRGMVEADETYVLESFKGQRKTLALSGRLGSHRGAKARKRGLSAE